VILGGAQQTESCTSRVIFSLLSVPQIMRFISDWKMKVAMLQQENKTNTNRNDFI
jgi:hypothetical protein